MTELGLYNLFGGAILKIPPPSPRIAPWSWVEAWDGVLFAAAHLLSHDVGGVPSLRLSQCNPWRKRYPHRYSVVNPVGLRSYKVIEGQI
jgi:hypothetical protein